MHTPLPVILGRHHACYPLLEAPDIYKLVHQGVFGPGHIVASVDAARRAIDDEVRRQKSEGRMQSEAERAVEEIDPEGRFVRVNLRPLLGRPGVAVKLAAILVESANVVAEDPAKMEARLVTAHEWCTTVLPDHADALRALVEAGKREGFSARHHSAAYQTSYRPSYRVVRLDLLEVSGLL